MSIHRQRGFTFIELMTAVTAGAIIVLAANVFLFKAYTWYDELASKIEINRHARETFNLLALGGMSSTTGNDATKNLYGLRERAIAPASGLRSNYALQYSSNNLTLSPDSFAAMSVTCGAAGTPLPDCAGTETKSVKGWIGTDIQLNTSSRSVASRTVEVTFVITDPFEVQRAQGPSQFSETYRTAVTLNRTESDP